MPELVISVAEAARQLGVSRVRFSRFINGRSAVSADLAIRLTMWLGGSAQSWMRMQADCDLWQAEHSGKPVPLVERIAASGLSQMALFGFFRKPRPPFGLPEWDSLAFALDDHCQPCSL